MKTTLTLNSKQTETKKVDNADGALIKLAKNAVPCRIVMMGAELTSVIIKSICKYSLIVENAERRQFVIFKSAIVYIEPKDFKLA